MNEKDKEEIIKIIDEFKGEEYTDFEIWEEIKEELKQKIQTLGQNERANYNASQSRSNKRDMGNSPPEDVCSNPKYKSLFEKEMTYSHTIKKNCEAKELLRKGGVSKK